jgi:hypothetical protein
MTQHIALGLAVGLVTFCHSFLSYSDDAAKAHFVSAFGRSKPLEWSA